MWNLYVQAGYARRMTWLITPIPIALWGLAIWALARRFGARRKR
jgi:hypothetical protein